VKHQFQADLFLVPLELLGHPKPRTMSKQPSGGCRAEAQQALTKLAVAHPQQALCRLGCAGAPEVELAEEHQTMTDQAAQRCQQA